MNELLEKVGLMLLMLHLDKGGGGVIAQVGGGGGAGERRCD